MKLTNKLALLVIVLFIFNGFAAANVQAAELEGGEIPRSHTIQGKVVNQFGNVIPSANIVFNDGSSNYQATSRNDGTYSIVILDDSRNSISFTFTISRAGYYSQTGSVSVSVNSPKKVDAMLDKAPGFLVEGYVRSPDGVAVSGATVSISYEDPKWVNGQLTVSVGQTTTSSSGYYYFHDSSSRSENYGFGVIKSGYATFSSVFSDPIGAVDYRFKEVTLSSGGYVAIHGQVRDSTSSARLADAHVKITRLSDGVVVADYDVDSQGYFYDSYSPTSSNYRIEISAEGYETKTFDRSGAAGSNHLLTVQLEKIPDETMGGSIFDSFVSKIKELAWDKVTEWKNAGHPIGYTKTFPYSGQFGLRGAQLEYELAFEIELVTLYSVKLRMDPLSNYIGVSLPPPFQMFNGIIGIGTEITLEDPDQNFGTFNPEITISHLEIKAGVALSASFSEEEIIEFIDDKHNGAKEAIENLLDRLDDLGLEIEIEGELNFFFGLVGRVNTDISVGVSQTEGFTANFELESLVFEIILEFDLSVSLSIEVEVELYDDTAYELELGSATLELGLVIDIKIHFFELEYIFADNKANLAAGKITLNEFTVTAGLSWEIFSIPGEYDIAEYSIKNRSTPWWWETSIQGDTSKIDQNYKPTKPSLSGSTNVVVSSPAHVYMTSVDHESDIKYQYKVGSGSITTTNWMTSGTTHHISYYWDTGTYTVYVRATDGELYSDWASRTYTVIGSTPNVPSVGGPSSQVVGKSVTFSAQSSDPDGGTLTYKFHWGDGSTTTKSASSGSKVYASHTYTSTGYKYIVVEVTNQYGNGNEKFVSINIYNNNPYRPSRPYGPSSGYEGDSLRYRFVTSDPNGHNVKYYISWGDGKYTSTGYYSSGTYVYRYHTYNYGGVRYYIKVKAADPYSGWTSWSYSKYVDVKRESSGGGGGGPIIMSLGTSVAQTIGLGETFNKMKENNFTPALFIVTINSFILYYRTIRKNKSEFDQ